VALIVAQLLQTIEDFVEVLLLNGVPDDLLALWGTSNPLGEFFRFSLNL
jgi:hypothetical protein